MTTGHPYRCIVCAQDLRKMFAHQSFEYWRCPNCAHVTTLPYPSRGQIVAHYQKGFADRNYRTVREHADTYRDVMRQLLNMLVGELVQRGHESRGTSLLDIGCFTGEFLEEAVRIGIDGYGVELQEEAVAIADERLPGRVRCADVLHDNFNFPPRQFNVVSLLGVIEHVTEPLQLLRRMHTLLAPGGIVFVQTPNAEALLATFMRSYWPPFAPVEHIHLFSRTSLQSALEQEGFTAITWRRHVKRLTPDYVYGMLQSFGPKLRPIIAPIHRALPQSVRHASLPFYVGEMMMFASRA